MKRVRAARDDQSLPAAPRLYSTLLPTTVMPKNPTLKPLSRQPAKPLRRKYSTTFLLTCPRSGSGLGTLRREERCQTEWGSPERSGPLAPKRPRGPERPPRCNGPPRAWPCRTHTPDVSDGRTLRLRPLSSSQPT